MRCDSCQQHVSWTGPLCIEPLLWEPSRSQAQCRQCIKARESFQAEMLVIAEDLADRAEHRASCSWCHGRRGLIPPLALSMACSKNRKEREARKVAA